MPVCEICTGWDLGIGVRGELEVMSPMSEPVKLRKPVSDRSSGVQVRT